MITTFWTCKAAGQLRLQVAVSLIFQRTRSQYISRTYRSNRETLAHSVHGHTITCECSYVADATRWEGAEARACQPQHLRLLLEPKVTSDGLRASAEVVTAWPGDAALVVPQRFFRGVDDLSWQIAARPCAVRCNAKEHEAVPFASKGLDRMGFVTIEEQEPGTRIERNSILLPKLVQLCAPIIIWEIKQSPSAKVTERTCQRRSSIMTVAVQPCSVPVDGRKKRCGHTNIA